MRGQTKAWLVVGACLCLATTVLVWREATPRAEEPGPVEDKAAREAGEQTVQGLVPDSGRASGAMQVDANALDTASPANPDASSTAPSRLRFLQDLQTSALAVQEHANWLKAPFGADEVEKLAAYIESPDTHGRSVEEDAAIRNGLMNALRRDPELASRLEELFYRMAKNDGLPEVFRDYALQHLVSLASQGDIRPSHTELLNELAADGHGSVAGTALLGLVRIEGVRPNAERMELIRYRAVLGAYDEANVEARMTALALAGDLGEQAGLQAAVEALQQSGSVALRVAAIGTIGKLGGASEAGLLRGILSGEEHYLKAAAGKAMMRIEERSL